MSNSLFSWDDADENPNVAAAAKSLAALDLSAANKEFEAQSEAFLKQQQIKAAGLDKVIPTPLGTATPVGQLIAGCEALEAKARESLSQLGGLEGGRVTVSEKFMLNCITDLNQLVPFKYPWAWSLYLTSTEQHWMPAECNLLDACRKLVVLTDNHSKAVLTRFYLNYKYRQLLIPESVLLNCYRLITNPEGRQYVLRHGFESAVVNHFIADIKEFTGIDTLCHNGEPVLTGQFAKDKEVLSNRYLLAKALTKDLHDPTFETKRGEPSTARFLQELIYLYGYVNWVMQIAPIYQMLNTLRAVGQDKDGIAKAIGYMIRDMQTQTMFIKHFLFAAFNENPEVLTPDFKAQVMTNFANFGSNEYLFAQSMQNTNTELDEIDSLVEYYTSGLLSSIGIPCQTITPKPSAMWFVELAKSLEPHVDLNAGLSGQGGDLAWE